MLLELPRRLYMAIRVVWPVGSRAVTSVMQTSEGPWCICWAIGCAAGGGSKPLRGDSKPLRGHKPFAAGLGGGLICTLLYVLRVEYG